MASRLQHRDRVFTAGIRSETTRRGSTSQACLQTILTVITTVPPPLAAASPSFSDARGGDRLELKEEGGNDAVPETSRKSEIETADNSLILLIEAAKMVFGEFKDDDDDGESKTKNIVDLEDAEIGRRLRPRKNCSAAREMVGEFDETTSSPVARSKRGRAQVLPWKYRDSVVETLTGLTKRRRR